MRRLSAQHSNSLPVYAFGYIPYCTHKKERGQDLETSTRVGAWERAGSGVFAKSLRQNCVHALSEGKGVHAYATQHQHQQIVGVHPHSCLYLLPRYIVSPNPIVDGGGTIVHGQLPPDVFSRWERLPLVRGQEGSGSA